MTVIEAMILGLVQGITEFLPVSSSGHLVVVQTVMGIDDPTIFVEVLLHLATVLAIMVFFRKRLLALRWADIQLLVVASIPAGIVGVFFGGVIVRAFGSILVTAVMLLLTGVINFLIDKRLDSTQSPVEKEAKNTTLTSMQALKVGVFQMLALVPGVSRSGATVLGGLTQGLTRMVAFEFSFLMAIPVIIGASIYEIITVDAVALSGLDVTVLGTGFLSAFIAGLASLWVLRFIIKQAKFEYFAGYCWVVGGALLLFSFFGVI